MKRPIIKHLEEIAQLLSDDDMHSQKDFVHDAIQIIESQDAALEKISKVKHGFQSILEDHWDVESKEFYKDAFEYYKDLSNRYQLMARKAKGAI